MIQRIQATLMLFGLWLITLLFRLITVKGTWVLGEWLGYLTYKILPGRRNVVRYNLEVVAQAHPELEVTEQLILSIFKRSFANLVCSIKTYGMCPSELSKFVTIDIHPNFKEAIYNNTGAILALAHMGNWEVLSKISSLIEPEPKKFGAVYRPLDNKIADEYVATQREKFGCQMFSKRNNISKLSSYIKDGGILGILADQRAGKSKKTARSFFSQPSPRSKLPAVLAKRTEAPLFSLSVHSPRAANWQITITPILYPNDIKVEDLVDIISRSYESSFYTHLTDVFWLHRYWNSGLNKHSKVIKP